MVEQSELMGDKEWRMNMELAGRRVNGYAIGSGANRVREGSARLTQMKVRGRVCWPILACACCR